MRILESIQQSIELKQKLLSNSVLISEIRKIAVACTSAYSRGNRVLFCGNGGSAADAQHLAAELSGRFYFDRAPLSSEALHTNIVLAMQAAQEMGILTVGLTGETGGKMKEHCDYLVNIPSTDTPRIQECHILVGHIICELIESALFPKEG